MSVRLWLETADCWRCATSIALDRLIAEPAHDAAQVTMRAAPPAPAAKPSPPAPAPRAKKVAAPPPIAAARARVASALAFEFGDVLSWLTSAIVHLVLMIVLGLLTFGKEEPPLAIVLSVDFDRWRTTREYMNEHQALVVPDFDLPIPSRPTTQGQQRILRLADEDARELRLDPDAAPPALPPIRWVKDAARSEDPYERMLAIRDPRIRAEVVRNEGGTTLTEAAVARGLRWIAEHQNRNGSWSIHAFDRGGDCDDRCGDAGSIQSNAGGTALALMALLGAGQTHRTGLYRDRVSHGLSYLLSIQEPNGDLRGQSNNQAGMYVHALGALVLCDAFKLTGDETLRGPAQTAIDFICAAQHDAGGWRYTPREEGDTSVIGWQLMALHSARAAFLDVPPEVLAGAAEYLDAAQTREDGSLYTYRPGGDESAAMTAEGLLSRMYLGWSKKNDGLSRGIQWLLEEHPPTRRDSNIYYWYYATQVMHHWGGEPWVEWNRQIRDVLVLTQETRGHEAGSWAPDDPHGHQGGRLYMTALACCTLEVYYRHAPLYRKIDLN
jgi:hypothetical protein